MNQILKEANAMCARKHKTAAVTKIMTKAELIDRYISLLAVVVRHSPIGINRLSEKTGMPQHKVRISLRMLQQDGLIEPTNKGAIPSGELSTILPRIKSDLQDCMKVLMKVTRIVDKMPLE